MTSSLDPQSDPAPADVPQDTVPKDTKDWSFAATAPCDECGYDPATVADADLGAALRDTVDRWLPVLGRAGVADRPSPAVWSPLEYACHVRDVHLVFTQRVKAMLAEDAPQFENWDQDDAAVAGRYFAADPATVAEELAAAGEEAAALYDSVRGDAWRRTGGRAGTPFTVSSIGHYHLHDVVHHLSDVGA